MAGSVCLLYQKLSALPIGCVRLLTCGRGTGQEKTRSAATSSTTIVQNLAWHFRHTSVHLRRLVRRRDLQQSVRCRPFCRRLSACPPGLECHPGPFPTVPESFCGPEV